MQTVTISITEHRSNPLEQMWELPMWGHPLGKMILPLFITSENNYWPIGTAFWFGRGISFVLTANHNVYEALRKEGRFDLLLTDASLPTNINLRSAGLCVLHQDYTSSDRVRFTLTPLESMHGAPPTDLIVGWPTFINGRQTISLPLSFDPPAIGQTVWSIGYTGFKPSRIPINQVRDGTFDWLNKYHHRFVVTEGIVERIFIRRFSNGFVQGPCFAFTNTIFHGQSGGPVISTDGRIIGINSAGAENFFNKPMSLGSMLFPLILTNLKFGVQFGPVRFSATYPMIDLIADKRIYTDNSELNLAFVKEDGEQTSISARVPTGDSAFIHDDFYGLQKGKPAAKLDKPFFRISRTQSI